MDKLREIWKAAGQEQVFAHVDELNADELASFQQQLERIDPALINKQFAAAQEAATRKADQPKPFSNIHPTHNRKQNWEAGLTGVAEGKAAALLLAGGQGTRLGFDHPKGMYDIGLPSGRTLFHLHAQRIQRVRILASRKANKHLDEIYLPFLVMTSMATFQETKDFFEKNNYFGLPRSDVILFQQGTNPCISKDGKILLANKGEICVSPDGNGSVYASLKRSGVLDTLSSKGVIVINTFAVDNVAVLPIDPVAVGAQLTANSELLVKSVERKSPEERVGVFAELSNGGLGVLEYSELPLKDAQHVNEDGTLYYHAAHICINSFTVDFVKRVVDGACKTMPMHLANRNVTALTENGVEQIAAIKLEAFIFDVFAEAKNAMVVMVDRAAEFSPLKNAPGGANATPADCRKALATLALQSVRLAGGRVDAALLNDGLVGTLSVSDDGDKAGAQTGREYALIEVSPLLSLCAMDLKDLSQLCANQLYERLPIQLEPVEHRPKNVLVTGGAGFIGSHVAIELVLNHPDYHVTVLDKLDYCSSMRNLDAIVHKPNFTFVRGDIRSADLVSYVLKSRQIDTILHLAAQTHVDNSFGNSLQFTENNVLGTHVLLECAKRSGIKRFVHISTDEVYGEVPADSDHATESETVLTPTNPYAATKAAAEFLVLAYYKSFGLPVIVTRGNNVYGSHQFPEKLIPKFAILLAQNKPVPIHGDGSNRRNFIYVSDVARALSAVMHRGTVGEIYNIGTDFELSNLDVAHYLCGLLKRDRTRSIQFVDDRPFNDCRYAIDSSKLHALAWQPLVAFDDGLAHTVAWYVARLNQHEQASVDESLGDHWDNTIVQQVLVAHPRMGIAAADNIV